MRILVIHQYFLGKNDPGGSRWNQFAKYWAAKGHQITVLAGNQDSTTSTIYPDCKGRLVTSQRVARNINVLRCHVSEAYNRSFLGRFWAYLTFLFSSLIAGLVCAPRPDVIVASSPPLTVAVTMWFLSVFYGVPAVFEVRDLWPQSAVETGVLKSRPLIWLGYRLEELAYRRANWINVLTPAFEQILVTRKRVSPRRISMIPNGADMDIMRPGPKDNSVRQQLGLKGKFVVSYFGAHGRANRVGQLLDVAERIKESHSDIRIMLVGNGMEKDQLVERAKRENLSNVIFVDAVPKDRVSDYINASDVCTAVLMKNETFKTVYPNKIFDYMSCKRPIVIAIDGVARKLVEDAGTGIYAEPEDPGAICSAIMNLKDSPDLAQQMGQRGLPFVRENFSREKLAERYLRIVLDVAANKRTWCE